MSATVQVVHWRAGWTATDGNSAGVGATREEAVLNLDLARRQDEMLNAIIQEAQAGSAPGPEPDSPVGGPGRGERPSGVLDKIAAELNRILPLIYGRQVCYTLLICDFGMPAGADWLSNGTLADSATAFAEFLGKMDPALVASVWERLRNQAVLGAGSERPH